MYVFIVVLIIIVAVLLALVVLAQNSKGGGLAANFSAPQQVMGVRQTADFMEKATWWLAGLLLVLSIVATASIGHQKPADPTQTEVTTNVVNPVQPVTTTAPVATPVEGTEAE